MSAFGQKQTCAVQKSTSALPPKADINSGDPALLSSAQLGYIRLVDGGSPPLAFPRLKEIAVERAFAALVVMVITATVPTQASAQDYAAIRCRARSQRRRSQHRQAPRPAQAVEFHRSEGRNEGARYGSGRWLYHRTFSAGGWTQWRRVRARYRAEVMERQVKDKFDLRAQKPAMKGVIHVIRNYDDPLPAGGFTILI